MKQKLPAGAVVLGVVYLASLLWAAVLIGCFIMLASIFSGCAHNTQCRAPEDFMYKKGVVLECSPGPVINGEPTKTCLVARPSGGAVTVNIRVGNCSP